MALEWKIVVDCADPHRQAAFWAAALGYRREDHGPLIARLIAAGVATEADTVVLDGGGRAWATAAAVRHPDDPWDEGSDIGRGRRLLFQRVPEPKHGKNRLHLDLHVGPERQEPEAERLVGLGATVLARVAERGQGHWVVLADPEGNEFCVA